MVQLFNLNDLKDLAGIGQKAASLRWLSRHGSTVPETYVLPFDGHGAYLADPSQFQQALRREFTGKLNPSSQYAVRSSANVEDDLAHSFAGQLTSVLAVHGLDEIVQAVITVYQSVQAPELAPYLERMALSVEEIQVAVIIQEMVEPLVSGIVFSKNPITGLDEVIVEAVRGSGESLMQDGITPERWVYKWGAWKEQPPEPHLGEDLISQVVEQSASIVDSYGQAADLEWVFDGQRIHWLQIRPITALDGLTIYSNRIAREVLPGMIKPLVWSINVPLVNSAWIDLFSELIGPNNLVPEDLSAAFHYRAYFNMKAIGQIMTTLGMPQETLELMMGLEGGSDKPSFRPTRATIRHVPRMIRFAAGKVFYAGRLERLIPALQGAYDDFQRRPILDDDEAAILERIGQLWAITGEAAYANIVTPSLMYAYNALLKRGLAGRNIDYMALDLTAGHERLRRYDPGYHLARLNQAFGQLDPALQQKIRASTYEEFQGLAGAAPFQELVDEFLDHFGHLSDSGNDFSSKPWRETPGMLLQLIADYGQTDSDSRPDYRWDDLPLSRLDRWRLRFLYNRARQFRFYREAVSFLYTYGYGLFRACFLSLGASFAARGLLEEQEDIFYLYFDEVKRLVQAGPSARSQKDVVEARREEMAASYDALLPDIIYGDQAPPLERAGAVSDRLIGVATSPGYYEGPARVIQSVAEHADVKSGDVLVIPYSDVSWTPLFSKAGAIVAESGGILSHSSIVAREHRLPAVVSVNGACQLLSNGTRVFVDGYRGEVLVSSDEGNAE